MHRSRLVRFGVIASLILLFPLHAREVWAAAPPVRFNRDVKPILADHCFACHGPDRSRRRGSLRLDQRR